MLADQTAPHHLRKRKPRRNIPTIKFGDRGRNKVKLLYRDIKKPSNNFYTCRVISLLVVGIVVFTAVVVVVVVVAVFLFLVGEILLRF